MRSKACTLPHRIVKLLTITSTQTPKRLDAIVFESYCRLMSETTRKRATVYFDPFLHRALRLKAAETDRSISELVNEAVKAALAEDADDFEAFEIREGETDYSFENVVKDLKRRGRI